MNNRNYRLVLECVILAAELARFATKFIVLVNTVINYSHDSEVVEEIPA
jgi:hypothetical protein